MVERFIVGYKGVDGALIQMGNPTREDLKKYGNPGLVESIDW